ncbi:PQQ-binding-like beta-propeller repeat protein [candidate division KSB1 bacterium]
MKNVIKLIALSAVSVILINVSFVFAQDWPQWRGVNRDGKIIGFEVPEKWPAELTHKWKVTVGTGDATPSLVDGRLYVFTRQDEDEIIRCIDAENGEELWRNSYSAQSVTGPARSHPGPRSSPTVTDGMVITLGVGSVLSCLDKATGEVVWRNDEFSEIVPAYFTGMSPIVINGMCIAHLGGKDKAAIVAFDLATGTEKWRWIGDGPAYGSPVLLSIEGNEQVISQTDKNLVSLSAADGKLLWQIPTPPQRRFYNSASPVIDGQTVIYTGHGLGTKAVTVQKVDDNFNVRELWSNEELGTAYNTPVLKGGVLYGLSNRGRLYCMNAGTGEINWTDGASHKNFGAILDAGSVIIALPSESKLTVYMHSGTEYQELVSYTVADSPVYAHPVIVGNRIYIKDNDSLAMWIIE